MRDEQCFQYLNIAEVLMIQFYVIDHPILVSRFICSQLQSQSHLWLSSSLPETTRFAFYENRHYHPFSMSSLSPEFPLSPSKSGQTLQMRISIHLSA